MHEIIFYEDTAGNKPVLEFIQELRSKNGKDARIRLNKVLEYIKVLETSGTAAGEPYTKQWRPASLPRRCSTLPSSKRSSSKWAASRTLRPGPMP